MRHRATALPLLVMCAAACGRAGAPAARPGKPATVSYDSGPNQAVVAALAGGPLRLGREVDASVPTPDDCLGHPVGARAAAPEAIIGCFRAWAARSPRVTVAPYAVTPEGRELVRAVITSEANQKRLDAILADVAALAEPRGAAGGAVDRLARSTPAVAWFGYSVHGDETSGADAATVFAYHLVAGTDAEVRGLLDQVVIVIDPVMNPDGRARLLTQVAQTTSEVPSLNHEGMGRGFWPYGRGNHYLFDLNRDWLAGAAPETRGRWRELVRFRPQLFVDAHEMQAQDTYLFYPRSAPHSPSFPATAARWHTAFAADQAGAFDAQGWPYYTREWADGWYPGYGDAWAEVRGAIGILYEQAETRGLATARRSGAVAQYRDLVLQQAVSSLANLRTLARNREAVLRDFAAHHRAQLADRRVFAVVPGRAPDRERRLVETLLRQGIEVHRASAAFTAGGVSAIGAEADGRKFPAGTLLVAAGQPEGALARALLEFDPRMEDEFLVEEREELERRDDSKIYDVTAWNLGMGSGLDAWWLDGAGVKRAQVTALDEVRGGVAAAAGKGAAIGWIVDGRDDASLAFAVAALARKIDVHAADEGLTAGGRSFARGSLLVRRSENAADVEAKVGEAARAAGVTAVAVTTGLSADDGPDLGGGHFHALVRPRVAMLSGAPIMGESMGHIWYLLDHELRVPVTLLEAMSLGDHDLRRYNVIVVPPAGKGLEPILDKAKEDLRAWVKAGGTLIAIAESAAIVADSSLGLTEVRRRSDVLDGLDLYRKAAEREIKSRAITVDAREVWEWTPPKKKKTKKDSGSGSDPGSGSGSDSDSDSGSEGEDADKPKGKTAAEIEDEWIRRFQPRGAFLRGLVDVDSWLTAGAPAELPVLVSSEHVLLSRAPVETPVRLGPPEGLRLSGLLWPEARAAWSRSAWATVERAGDGQVILFASSPSFRMLLLGTARMLANAIVLGPGMGASHPIDW